MNFGRRRPLLEKFPTPTLEEVYTAAAAPAIKHIAA
jgi:hypothetical protein